MNKYFGLFYNCKYTSGKNGGCLYDIISGKMIATDKELDKLLKKALRNQKVETENVFLKELIENNMGEFYDYPIMGENIIDGRNIEKYQIVDTVNRLERVYIQITNECNKICDFCKESSIVYTKTHCKKWENIAADISKEIWEENFQKMRFLGLKEVRFIGGNPFLELKKMKDIIKIAKLNNINRFCVYSNLEILNDDMILACKENKIVILAQIVEWNSNLEKNLESCISSGIEIVASVLITPKNIKNYREIIKELNDMGIETVNIDYLRNSIDAMKREAQVDLDWNKKIFGRISEQSLTIYEICNTCLYGQIYINLSGAITPCPMMNDIILGNVVTDDLYEILAKDAYQEVIHLTRNKLPGCCECAYRYNCPDCRAVEMSQTGNLYHSDFCIELNKMCEEM